MRERFIVSTLCHSVAVILSLSFYRCHSVIQHGISKMADFLAHLEVNKMF